MGVTRSGIDFIKSCIPPSGTVDRTIFNLTIAGFVADLFRNSICAAYATLELQKTNRTPENDFIKWIKKINPSLQKAAEAHPVLHAHLYGLIHKVIVAAGFYATSHISLYDTLTHLLSSSQKVSNTARPLLDKVASMPIPRPLKSVTLLTLAPVVAKLLHMYCIQDKTLPWVEKGAAQISSSLAFLWSLRLSLICLGVSKNLPQTIVSILFTKTLNFLVEDQTIRAVVGLANGVLAPQLTDNLQGFKYLWSLTPVGLGNVNFWPTQGVKNELSNMWQTLFAPSDLANIEKLFSNINQATENAAIYENCNKLNKQIASGTLRPCYAPPLYQLSATKLLQLSSNNKNIALQSIQDALDSNQLYPHCAEKLSALIQSPPIDGGEPPVI